MSLSEYCGPGLWFGHCQSSFWFWFWSLLVTASLASQLPTQDYTLFRVKFPPQEVTQIPLAFTKCNLNTYNITVLKLVMVGECMSHGRSIESNNLKILHSQFAQIKVETYLQLDVVEV